jgi:hypothetical protein
MCRGCWEKYETPQIDNPVVREARRAIDAVYEFSCVGGNLHIAIDDWNLDDGDLDSCAEFIAENEDGDGPEQLAAERYCLGLLREMSEDERASALALQSGFWG